MMKCIGFTVELSNEKCYAEGLRQPVEKNQSWWKKDYGRPMKNPAIVKFTTVENPLYLRNDHRQFLTKFRAFYLPTLHNILTSPSMHLGTYMCAIHTHWCVTARQEINSILGCDKERPSCNWSVIGVTDGTCVQQSARMFIDWWVRHILSHMVWSAPYLLLLHNNKTHTDRLRWKNR